MKRRKNNLDERQELELLRIEHIGMWFVFWALFGSIVIQGLMGAPLRQWAAEFIIFIVLSLGFAAACMYHGIWDRYLKPNLRTNLLLSLAGGVFYAAFLMAMMYFRHGCRSPLVLAAGAAIGGLFIFALCFLALTAVARVTGKRRQQLDQTDADDED